ADRRKQEAVDREPAGRDVERVAVGGGAGDEFGRDVAAGARLVVHDDLLAPHFREPRTDDAADRIDAAAGRERHHELDDPVRPGGAMREAAASGEWRKRGCAREHHEMPHEISTIEHPYSSDLMPAALMTGPQRSISDLSSRASSAGVEPTTPTPAFSM